MDRTHPADVTCSSPSEAAGRPGCKAVGRRHLVNRLNYLNFLDRTLSVTLEHRSYTTTISLQAKPFPCSGDRLDCSWVPVPDLRRILASHRFKDLLICEENRVLLVKAEVIGMSETGFCLLLPEFCHEVASRRIRRHHCAEIQAVLSRDGAEYRGTLRDFTPVSFRLEIPVVPAPGLHWPGHDRGAHLRLAKGDQPLFTGEVAILRQALGDGGGSIVVAPLHQRINRFRPKNHRSARQELIPAPRVEFLHPLFHQRIELSVVDLSLSGFAVEEEESAAVLLPGMILPEVAITFADRFTISCSAQVVYRTATEGSESPAKVKCGLAVLDMEQEDHLRLAALLSRAADGNSHLCNSVDMDALWRFFFESGFISPQKYVFFQKNKEEMKAAFNRLYSRQSGIARHFIYQDKGRILGHMAMIRTYDRSWLIHHHAADRSESVRAGLVVLNQISRYVNEAHHLKSAHLDYVYCYYRPDNRFPERVFGQFARHLNDRDGCSLDPFAYFHHQERQGGRALPRPWELDEAHDFDLQELRRFYRHHSGGLLLDAFCCGSGSAPLAGEYARLGLRKESFWMCLKKEGKPRALFLVNITGVGLNMSNLTNCVTALVLDPALPGEVLDSALSVLADRYEGKEMPVLLYPRSYADKAGITPEKNYNLWILNLQYLDRYFDFCSDIFRHIPGNGSSPEARDHASGAGMP